MHAVVKNRFGALAGDEEKKDWNSSTHDVSMMPVKAVLGDFIRPATASVPARNKTRNPLLTHSPSVPFGDAQNRNGKQVRRHDFPTTTSSIALASKTIVADMSTPRKELGLSNCRGSVKQFATSKPESKGQHARQLPMNHLTHLRDKS